IKDLGNDRYSARQQAAEELEKLRDLVEPNLTRALTDSPVLEIRRRIEQLLEKLHGPVSSPQLLQGLRAIEALEYIGTSDARQLLEPLARGAPGARLTREANESIERLKKAAEPAERMGRPVRKNE